MEEEYVFPGCRARCAPCSGHTVLAVRVEEGAGGGFGNARSRSSSICFGELHDGRGAVGVQQGLQNVLELLVA